MFSNSNPSRSTPTAYPKPLPCRFPTHLIEPLVRSFKNDHYVDDTGDIVFYKRDPAFPRGSKGAAAAAELN